MNPQTAKQYVILVHFGSPKPTDRALLSLFAGQKVPTEVIIIDHAHQPYSWNGPQPVTVLRPPQNAGYGAGVNSGLGFLSKRKLAERDIVIVMNNDVVVSPTSLQQLNPPPLTLVGVRGGRIKWFSGRTQPAYRTGRLDKKPTNYLDGAFLAATWETWGKLRGMPEQYFLYWEDVAISTHARQRGITLNLLPNLAVAHQPTHQHQETTDRLYHLVKSGAYFMEHQAPRPWRRFWWVKNRLRYLYHRWFSGSPNAPLITRALRDARTN